MESCVSLLKEAFSEWLIDFAGRYEEISEQAQVRKSVLEKRYKICHCF